VSTVSTRYCNSIVASKSICRVAPILQLVDGLEQRKLQILLFNVTSKMAALLLVIGVPLRMPRSKAWELQIQQQVLLVIFRFMIFYLFICYESAYTEYDVRGVHCLLSPDAVLLCWNSVHVICKCY